MEKIFANGEVNTEYFVSRMGEYVKQIKAANPDARRAELIVYACAHFYQEGFEDAVRMIEREVEEREKMEELGL